MCYVCLDIALQQHKIHSRWLELNVLPHEIVGATPVGRHSSAWRVEHVKRVLTTVSFRILPSSLLLSSLELSDTQVYGP